MNVMERFLVNLKSLLGYFICLVLWILLVTYGRSLKFRIIFYTAHSFGDNLAQFAYLDQHYLKSEDGIIFCVPIAKRKTQVRVRRNDFLYLLAKKSANSQFIFIKHYFISRIFSIIVGTRLKLIWSRMFKGATIKFFYEEFGIYSMSNSKIQDGMRRMSKTSIFEKAELGVREKFGIESHHKILVLGARMSSWHQIQNVKPSALFRSSTSDRYELIAEFAIRKGYRVITVGDPGFKITSDGDSVYNYAAGKRDAVLDVVIPSLATVIVGNLFGATDMRYLASTQIPFLAVDIPLPSVCLNPGISMAAPTRVIDCRNDLPLPIVDLNLERIWSKTGWGNESNLHIRHEYSTNIELVNDFEYFLINQEANSYSVCAVCSAVANQLRQCDFSKGNRGIEVETFKGVFSPSFCKFLNLNSKILMAI